MSQVSYGTITITDTNDIESIAIEYNKNQSNQNPPSEGDSNWSTNRPTWQQGYYIWQRTRIHKSGTATTADIIGTPVCVTGSTGEQGQPGQQGQPGAAGRSLTGVETKYCIYSTGTPSDNYSGWQDTIPEYNSSTPNYWVKVTNTYSEAPTTEVVKYKDTGITNAMAKAADAQSRAATAETNASDALSLSQATQQHFWFNSVKTGNIEAGAYITDVVIDSFKPNKSGNYLLAGSNGIELGNGTHPYMQLTASELNFFHPNSNNIDAQLSSNGLIVKSGGIEAGTVGQNGGIYLSTKNYGTTHNNQTITINDHEATNWRQIIGTKFGVDSDGVLYASGANIQGKITVTSGSNVYTTDNVNPLEIGGRNLLLDSKSMESWSYGTDASLNSVDDFGEAVLIPIENNTWNAIISTRPTLNSSILNGNSMILSFEYTLSEDCTIAIGVDGSSEEPNTSSSITKTKYITKYYNLNTATAWNKFSAIMPTTIEELTLGSGEVNSFSISIANYLKANTIMKIRKVQLEYGNTATDWSPSPEDMSEDIVLAIQTLKDDTESELATIQSEFDITADNIASQVSKKVGYDEIISVINQTAEEIKIEANKIDIEALTEQMTFSASNIVFGNTNVADSLNELNAAVSIDTETSTIYVGDRQGFHVRIDGSQLGFYQAGESDPIAYIKYNQLYITQSVVLQQMDIGTSKLNNGDGQWSWKIHKNVNGENNLYLKWMG